MTTLLPCNNPSDFLTDFRNLNIHSPQIKEAFPLVIGTIVNNITTGSRIYYMVIDIYDMFFTISVDEESQLTATLTWEGQQYSLY